MAELVLREGLDQPRPLAQIEALVADGQLQQTLPRAGDLTLVSGAWLIGIQELQNILGTLSAAGQALTLVVSDEPRTRVAAAALGLRWQAPADSEADGNADAAGGADGRTGLRVHQGTLRAGDQLETEGSLLVLGDVNPGARVSAGGHVLVWGTLRGVAHAGSGGDTTARITALQLRPLQLRIADAVARGPEDLPVAGFAEQAELIDGLIAINPAAPQWPLS